MKKGLLTSIICFSSLVFSSCGSKYVKVTLKGDDYIEWEKTSDKATAYKEYIITARSKVRGYTLYYENIDVRIGGVLASYGEEFDYIFDENTLTLKIFKKSVSGDIEIIGTGREKEIYITYVYDSTKYVNIPSSPTLTEFNNDYSLKGIDLKPELKTSYKMPSSISVSPNINYTYEKDGGSDAYNISINGNQLYENITITFPEPEPK